jgi:Leucine-rich repeat (LRR) protein
VPNGTAFSPSNHNSDENPYLMEPISENERTKAKTTSDLLMQPTHYAAVPQNIPSKQITRIPPNRSLDTAHYEVERQYPHNQSIHDDSDLENAARNKFSSFPAHAVGFMDETSLFPGTIRQRFVSELFSNECVTINKLEIVQAPPVIDHDYPIVMKDEIVYVDSSPLTLQSALKNNKSIHRCFIMSIIVVIVITIIVTVIILKGAKNKLIEQPTTGDASDWEHTSVPSSAPTFISEEVLNAAADISGWSSLDTLGSPQFRAVGWMSSIDNISIEKSGPWFLQRYSLLVFYFSTGGTFWINQEDWLNPTLHECDWSNSIQCTINDSEMRVVTGLDATLNGLSGTLPDELKFFTDLEFLHIPRNNVSGVIPNAIGELVKLSSLDLSLNQFSRSIPQTIGNADSIVVLDISHNAITGTIPKDIYKLTLLEILDLSWNAISGPIIDDMENLDQLAVFDIRHNILHGTLPKALTILSALDYILLDDNAFTGTLPKLSMAMGKCKPHICNHLFY